jgi:hypothetical protein
MSDCRTGDITHHQAKMYYQKFDHHITTVHHIIMEGWLLPQFCCPSDVGSLTEIQLLYELLRLAVSHVTVLFGTLFGPTVRRYPAYSRHHMTTTQSHLIPINTLVLLIRHHASCHATISLVSLYCYSCCTSSLVMNHATLDTLYSVIV